MGLIEKIIFRRETTTTESGAATHKIDYAKLPADGNRSIALLCRVAAIVIDGEGGTHEVCARESKYVNMYACMYICM